MKQYLPIVLALLLMPATASAHETHRFEIDGEIYQFTIGSLNEPIVVDDKSGVDLRVSMPEHADMAANDHHAAGGAVTGLEEALQVELIAGDARLTQALSPVYGTPGSYKTSFYPTVATTMSYRIYGSIAETPFDYTFTCSAAGHAVATEDTTRVPVSDDVVRVFKSGSYGCPVPKADLGFPERSAEIAALREQPSGTYVPYLALLVSFMSIGYIAMRTK